MSSTLSYNGCPKIYAKFEDKKRLRRKWQYRVIKNYQLYDNHYFKNEYLAT